MKEKIVIIVQARMGSSRFPGKMLQPLGPYPIIHWVLARLGQNQCGAKVVVATSDQARDDELAAVITSLGVAVYRGSENDVLSRFVQAAQQYEADHIVRVCADNPFVASQEIDKLIAFYLANRPDYAFNHIPKHNNHYPDGLGGEILSVKTLMAMDQLAYLPSHREHVTQYIWDHANDFSIATFQAETAIAFPHVKLDVDTPEDLQKLSRLDCLKNLYASSLDIVRSYQCL